MSSYQANLYKDQRLDMGCQRRDSIYFKIKKNKTYVNTIDFDSI
jgi:hypothetical protein